MATSDRPDPTPAPPAVRVATPPARSAETPAVQPRTPAVQGQSAQGQAAVRAVARVRPPHRAVYRGGANRQRAERVPRSYRFVLLSSNPRPVFVDDTGRRGRLLGVASVVLAAIALLLLAAFWWSQTTWPGVDPMPQGTGVRGTGAPGTGA